MQGEGGRLQGEGEDDADIITHAIIIIIIIPSYFSSYSDYNTIS